METRLVPDAPGAWLVYDLGTLVLAVPQEFRAAADAVAAKHPGGLPEALTALRSSGLADPAPFAVLDARADGLHLALRGPATLAAGAETLTGLGAEPWLERVLPSAAVVRLTVPGGEWTLTLASAPAPAARPTRVQLPEDPVEVRHVTEVPDVETSVPADRVPADRAPQDRVPAPVPPPPLGLGEHDGMTVRAVAPALDDDRTVVVDEVARVRARRSAELVPPAPAADLVSPAHCLELPDGSREPIDGVVLVGRAPSAPADAPSSRLLRLDGDGDISRNHARVEVEGGTVVVTDLGSRNGTIVRIPGRPDQQLRSGEPTPVLVGSAIDFGGGLVLSVREA